MKQFFCHNHKGWTSSAHGFTLIETLFAILIFSAALVSLMAITGRGIAAAQSAREQVVAHYLAQEGLEIARNMRDRGEIATLETCTITDKCKVVYGNGSTVPTLEDCGGVCSLVKEMNNAFVDNGSDSLYNRSVYVVPNYPDTTGIYNEHQVISEISWVSKNITRRVVLRTLLKKWQ